MAESPPTAAPASTGSTTGIAATAKYNPHLWSPDELRAIFVARKQELSAILQVIKTAVPGVAPQHMLITGQRGMGKSTLLQRVALAVEDDPLLHTTWLPLRFPEEQYTVSSPAELWANVIGALADALERQGQPTLDIDAELSRLMNLPKELREATSLDWINKWCDTHQRRLLLLMDSTDLLFANLASSDANKRGTQQDGGASSLWRVRKALMHSPNLLWLGGSYQPLEANGLYSDAFLDFFQLIELRPLTLAEMQNAILAMARLFGAGRGLQGNDAEADVLGMLQRRPERLRAMRQLTGGNPRTTVMLYELFSAGGKDSVRADLERLLDAMTPLYKARLEVLADQPRKVLAHVMENWAPITANALAKAATLPVSTVSTQLSRLEQEGLVGKTALSGTKRLGYECTERFFNIWYLMRNAPRGARARVGWLVEFMRLWYSDDELRGLARARWAGHREGLLGDVSDLEYSRAIARALPEHAQDGRQLEWSVFQQARKGPGYKEIFELDGEDASYSTPDNYLTRFDALQNALVKAPLAPEDCLRWAEEVKRDLHLTLAEKEGLAKECGQMSTAKLGEVRLRLPEMRERLITNHARVCVEQVERAVADGAFFPDCPESGLALIQLIHCFEASPSAFAVAVGLLVARRCDTHAEQACKRSIELAPTSARPFNTYGYLLWQLNRLDEAEAAYRKAIEIDPKWVTPRGFLSVLLGSQPNRLVEAEVAWREAIEIDPKWATAWSRLGDLLGNQPNRLDDAEAAYRKAIEINPKWAGYWGQLGDLLRNQPNRLDEAEAAYRSAIGINPKWATPWSRLGDLLGSQPNRLDEAEAAYRTAIEINPKSDHYWMTLGNLLQDKSKRFGDAKEAYREAAVLAPNNPFPLANMARLLAASGRKQEASDQYRKALAIAGDEHDYLRLQAHCWLGNSDLALQALDKMAELATMGNSAAFYRLKEQCFECHAIGVSKPLGDLMVRSQFADFLMPFALALRAADGDEDALLDAAVEVRGIAQEVLAQIEQKS